MNDESHSRDLNALRTKACDILSVVGTCPSTEQATNYSHILDRFLQLNGPKDDYIVKIGETFFDYFVKGGVHDRTFQG